MRMRLVVRVDGGGVVFRVGGWRLGGCLEGRVGVSWVLLAAGSVVHGGVHLLRVFGMV